MNAPKPNRNGRILVGVLACALFVLHQDFWLWDNRTLVLGFLPIGLFYHGIFSIAAGLVWALANKVAWPEHIEEWAAEGDRDTAEGGNRK